MKKITKKVSKKVVTNKSDSPVTVMGAIGANIAEVGTSVIDGHSGYKNNVPAVFDNLHKL